MSQCGKCHWQWRICQCGKWCSIHQTWIFWKQNTKTYSEWSEMGKVLIVYRTILTGVSCLLFALLCNGRFASKNFFADSRPFIKPRYVSLLMIGKTKQLPILFSFFVFFHKHSICCRNENQVPGIWTASNGTFLLKEFRRQ